MSLSIDLKKTLVGVLLLAGCMGETPEKDSRAGSPAVSTTMKDSARPYALMTKEEREALREQLSLEGKYDCCVKPGCTECIADRGECNCYLDIKQKDPICGECFDGYREGRGKLKMVSIPELERIRKERSRKIQ